MRKSKCHRCHNEIWFGEMEKGGFIPINAWASPRGKIIAIDPDADRPMVQFLKKSDAEPPEGTRRYISHIVTCKKKSK